MIHIQPLMIQCLWSERVGVYCGKCAGKQTTAFSPLVVAHSRHAHFGSEGPLVKSMLCPRILSQSMTMSPAYSPLTHSSTVTFMPSDFTDLFTGPCPSTSHEPFQHGDLTSFHFLSPAQNRSLANNQLVLGELIDSWLLP